jgi:hypothetical protein
MRSSLHQTLTSLLSALCLSGALLGAPAAQAHYVSGGGIYDEQAKRITIRGVN